MNRSNASLQPLYLQVKRHILDNIGSGKWGTSTRVPPNRSVVPPGPASMALGGTRPPLIARRVATRRARLRCRRPRARSRNHGVAALELGAGVTLPELLSAGEPILSELPLEVDGSVTAGVPPPHAAQDLTKFPEEVCV